MSGVTLFSLLQLFWPRCWDLWVFSGYVFCFFYSFCQIEILHQTSFCSKGYLIWSLFACMPAPCMPTPNSSHIFIMWSVLVFLIDCLVKGCLSQTIKIFLIRDKPSNLKSYVSACISNVVLKGLGGITAFLRSKVNRPNPRVNFSSQKPHDLSLYVGGVNTKSIKGSYGRIHSFKLA